MRRMRVLFFFFQAEDGIRDLVRSRGLGDVYKRQDLNRAVNGAIEVSTDLKTKIEIIKTAIKQTSQALSLIHI